MSIIYISGPYSVGDRLENVSKAIDIAEQISAAGHTCFIPHLNHFWNERHEHDYNFWMDQDLDMLSRCDALVRMPGDSPGADEEWGKAIALGIPVFFWTVSLPLHL
jgi:hypothetical protein